MKLIDAKKGYQKISWDYPFKFPCHLILALEINGIIAMSDKNIHSAEFN
jgi:hypothetical protein